MLNSFNQFDSLPSESAEASLAQVSAEEIMFVEWAQTAQLLESAGMVEN